MSEQLKIQFVADQKTYGLQAGTMFVDFITEHLRRNIGNVQIHSQDVFAKTNSKNVIFLINEDQKVSAMQCLDQLFILGRYMGRYPEYHAMVPGSEIRYYFVNNDPNDYAHERASVMTALAIKQQMRIGNLEKYVTAQTEKINSLEQSIMGLQSYFHELLGMGGLPAILDGMNEQIENLGGDRVLPRSVVKALNSIKH